MRGIIGRSEFWYNRLILCRRKTGRVIGSRRPRVGLVGPLFVSGDDLLFMVALACGVRCASTNGGESI